MRKMSNLEKHARAVFKDPKALIDDCYCPVCNQDFKVCRHGYDAVKDANFDIFIKYIRLDMGL